jgi:hypothetical protein
MYREGTNAGRFRMQMSAWCATTPHHVEWCWDAAHLALHHLPSMLLFAFD